MSWKLELWEPTLSPLPPSHVLVRSLTNGSVAVGAHLYNGAVFWTVVDIDALADAQRTEMESRAEAGAASA